MTTPVTRGSSDDSLGKRPTTRVRRLICELRVSHMFEVCGPEYYHGGKPRHQFIQSGSRASLNYSAKRPLPYMIYKEIAQQGRDFDFSHFFRNTRRPPFPVWFPLRLHHFPDCISTRSRAIIMASRFTGSSPAGHLGSLLKSCVSSLARRITRPSSVISKKLMVF
jgi:hypothetical protein